jgi:hypothetical protein
MKLEGLVKCPGLELDPTWCGSWIERRKRICIDCLKRETRANPRRKLKPRKPEPMPVVNVEPTMAPVMTAVSATKTAPALIGCVGVNGAHECNAKVDPKRGRKRCASCESRFQQARARRADPVKRPPPKPVAMAGWQKQLERLKVEGRRR